MKSTCKKKFIQQITKIREKPEHQTCNQAILILDQKSTAALNQILTLEDMFDHGIKTFTKIEHVKKPEVNLMGIYFISQDSVKKIQKDFQKKPIYFSINILVCDTISQDTMKFVANSEKIMQRLATFTEFHFPVTYYNEKLAIFPNSDGYLKSIYQQLNYIAQEIGEKIFETIMASFNSVSQVELYYSDQSKFGISAANRVLKCFQSYQSSKVQEQNELTSIPMSKKGQQTDDITVVFFDRTIDFVSPIVRNFYYFPMISDFYDIRDFKNLTISNVNMNNVNQEIKIDKADKIFMNYKNMHYSDAIIQITRDLQKFTKQNKAARFQKSKQSTSNNQDLQDVIKQFPQYTKTVKNYNIHISILGDISTKNKKDKISELCELQQLIITSLTRQAEVLKDKQILKKALQVMSTLNNIEAKARIIFLILQCLQISQKQKQDFLSFFDKNPGFEGFSTLFQRPPTGKLKYHPLVKKQSLFLDRHQCIIAKRCQQILIEKPSKGFKKLQFDLSSQQKSSKFKKLQKKSKKKLLVIMVGGLSVNQISNIERFLQKNQAYELYFLTDHITTPKIFLQDLKSIFKQSK